MSLGTSNRDGGKTSESGHLRALAKLVNGDVLEGLAVSQRGAGANMSVDVAVGDAFIRRSDGSYAHPVFNDAVYNQVIAAADGSNPRRDLIVLYVDYGQTPSTSVSNNTNGVVKIKVVTGTPAGSPVDPNSTAIQSSVGAGNPYTVLARVRVPAGQTSITNSLIDDLRSLITNKDNTVGTLALVANAVTLAKVDQSTFPKFSANRTAAYTLVSGTATKMPINVVEYDTHSGFSTANNRYTVQAGHGGNWSVKARASYTSVTSYGWIELRKNGVLYKKGNLNTPNNEYVGHVLDVDIPLVPGDYIELWYQTGQAPNLESGAATTYFQGRLLP
jgi:hypothetical protein